MQRDLTIFFVTQSCSLRQAVAQMDINRYGIVLVVDDERRLVGTVTDGDVRRAILAKIDLEQRVTVLLGRKADTFYAKPITARVGQDRNAYLALLQQHGIVHLPILDDDDRIAGLVMLDEFVPNRALPLQAVIMAGGVGRRLRPLTEEFPKPMLPVGDRPLLELTIEQLRRARIQRVYLTTHYKAAMIAQHFGDGRDFGVDIQYVEEDQPLGTAGALSLLDVSDEPLLIMNGDVLTGIDFQAMLDFHGEYKADMTVAVRQHETFLPHGVVETDGIAITGISEKPVIRHFMNAGIYILNPGMCRFVPIGRPYDMTELISRLIAEGCRVVCFPIREYWLDIGQSTDYEQAQEDLQAGKIQP